MVEQRAVALPGIALFEHDRGSPGDQAAVLELEAELGELREGGVGVGDTEGDMVEVVGDALVYLDEGQPEPLAGIELGAAVHPLDGDLRGEGRQRLVQIEHPQADPREHAGLTLARPQRRASACRAAHRSRRA